ncbi:TRAP transporter small permease [Rhodobacteraceae bacterium RKSG542]|uniref:TRAP transporter small permease n=1 Tax=Pseudovibrio flavus TaxID=2529854 RepID=UPI0012BD2BCA|nr:TRAP transporter small permease subunit [Pseudovibrio flavus]MTI17664.1 TRAP transporter small permease [Pseudovibrio flavus]
MKALHYLRLAERSAIVSIFLLMVFLFFANVLVREFGGQLVSKFAWIEEGVRLLNLFLVFLGLGLALERGRHVSIDSIRDQLPAEKRRILIKVIDLSGFLLSIYMIVLSYRISVFVFASGQTSPTLDMSMGWIYLAPAVGFSLLALRYALSFFGVINRYADKPGANSEEEEAA